MSIRPIIYVNQIHSSNYAPANRENIQLNFNNKTVNDIVFKAVNNYHAINRTKYDNFIKLLNDNKDNNNLMLHEYICDNVKLFCDIDYQYDNKIDVNKKCKQIISAIVDALNSIHIHAKDISVCQSNREGKISMHIIFNNNMGFKNIMQQKFIWKIINSILFKQDYDFNIDEQLYKSPLSLRTIYSTKNSKNKLKPYLISLDKDNIIQPIQNYLINHGPNKYTKYNEDYLIQLIMEYDLKDNLIYFKNYENILDELKENEIIDDSNINLFIDEQIKQTYNTHQKILTLTIEQKNKIKKVLDMLNEDKYNVRENWLKVMFALKNYSDDTKNLALYFTQKSKYYKDDTYFENTWNSIRDTNRGITMGTIYMWAKECI